MSTPTTATATLPRYHYPPSYTHAHLHHQGYPASPNSSYRSAAVATTTTNLNLPPTTSSPASSTTSGPRLPPPYQIAATATSTLNYPAVSSHGVTSSSAARPAPPHDPPPTTTTTTAAASSVASRHDANYSAAPMASAASSNTVDQPSRKRRRSREPDWSSFYKNGLPKEIIVIDDTPEPEANTGRKITNGTTTVTAAVPNDSVARQPPARKRRRDDEPATVQGSGYHIKYLGSQHNTPQHNGTPAGSNSSSDRTNSALNTTAPTSLSSNGDYDDAQAPQKRKRTRQQVANEAKRRDVDGLGDPFFTYKPPPFPPKKAGDVNVRVVHDVSNLVPSPYREALLTVCFSATTIKMSKSTMTMVTTLSYLTQTSPRSVSVT